MMSAHYPSHLIRHPQNPGLGQPSGSKEALSARGTPRNAERRAAGRRMAGASQLLRDTQLAKCYGLTLV